LLSLLPTCRRGLWLRDERDGKAVWVGFAPQPETGDVLKGELGGFVLRPAAGICEPCILDLHEEGLKLELINASLPTWLVVLEPRILRPNTRGVLGWPPYKPSRRGVRRPNILHFYQSHLQLPISIFFSKTDPIQAAHLGLAFNAKRVLSGPLLPVELVPGLLALALTELLMRDGVDLSRIPARCL